MFPHTIDRTESVSLTDIGTKKSTNQDRLLVREISRSLQLFAVIDGLGGQPGGEEAADTALATFTAFTQRESEYNDSGRITDLLFRANAAIIARGDAEPELYNMGAAATLLLIDENRAHWAHIGDCRLYHLHAGRLNQITTDHNLAWDLFERGEIDAGERQHHRFNQFLSQCLGEDDIEPSSGSFDLTAGDTLLLCTDGIHDMLTDEEIAEILLRDCTLSKRAGALLTAALTAGGKDNIALILIQFHSERDL